MRRGIMEGIWLIVMIFAILLIVLFTGIPVAFSLGLVAFGGLIFLLGTDGTIKAAGTVIFGSLKEFSFIALPLFIMMAQILAVTGIGAELFEALGKWLNRVPGPGVSAVAAAWDSGRSAARVPGHWRPLVRLFAGNKNGTTTVVCCWVR
jgi:TRAP-type mannitol/chloroaromatic compound transport system permease large subunit